MEAGGERDTGGRPGSDSRSQVSSRSQWCEVESRDRGEWMKIGGEGVGGCFLHRFSQLAG